MLRALASTWLALLIAISNNAFAGCNDPLRTRADGGALPPVAYGLRDQADTLEAFARANGMETGRSETKQFGELGNVFVRIDDFLASREAVILLPASVTADQLMELLIKARTAWAGGAERITIASPGPIEETQVADPRTGEAIRGLSIESLFAAAGAGRLKQGAARERALRSRWRRVAAPLPSGQAVILSDDYPELARSIADETREEIVFAPIEAAEALQGRQVYYVLPSGVGVNSNLLRGLARIRQLELQGNRVHVVTPNALYARTDKIDQDYVAVIAQFAARLLEAAGAGRVSFVRAHSAQHQGFHDVPTWEASGKPTIRVEMVEQGTTVAGAPDAGSEKYVASIADGLGLPVAVVSKVRDPRTQEIRMRGMTGASVRDQVVMYVDDELETGGTSAQGAEAARRRRAERVVLFSIHLTGTARKALDSPAVQQVIVTDTVPVAIEHPKLRVVSIAPELAAQLLRLDQARRSQAPRAGARAPRRRAIRFSAAPTPPPSPRAP